MLSKRRNLAALLSMERFAPIAVGVAASLLAGCSDPDAPVVKPADRGIEISQTQIKSALGRIQTAVNAAEFAASAAAPKIFVDKTLEQKSYLCVDAQKGAAQMDYTTKGQFKRTLSDGSSEIGFRFESFEGMNRFTGVQYGKSEPVFYKTSLSDGQSAEVWSEAKSGSPAMRCFRSIGKEYLWFDPQLTTVARAMGASAWRCTGQLEALGDFSLDMAGRAKPSSGGAAQFFIWAEKQALRIDVFKSPQPWPTPDTTSTQATQAAPALIFTSVAEYTLDVGQLASGVWSYEGASGKGGSCSKLK